MSCMLQWRISTPRIVILASGNGSNFEAIVRASKTGKLRAEILELIVDRNCKAVERSKNLGIPCVILGKNWKEELRRILDGLNPDLVVLAGFMRILPKDIVENWHLKIVNIHPSLLPSFPGMNAIRKAYEYGVKVTGITIHFVNEEVDAGPIIFQKAIELNQNWSLEELEKKIHEVEHEWYPKVINALFHKRWKIEGRRVKFEKNLG